ncbi:type II toxin-antitoxin system mRNA interferase toxin, RelE/StbE family [Candidatus Shapirobacteria bacterium CG09_land_8_20_14_0_10_39_12]|uniref:Type II toxin-antitoxin system mRNA interferase toxin, RelE/StbE family n=1 Tax=Candidatus Shapirobacteria bacterium CG09_land_8_20_14_0_10_39_12 TaxID=1974885 RepID=A0A2H0WQ57_9BACT|nr:MAG: type II toxin-antitoxin system mRNA interferase toxin, RelE/StbE family [Candidatus Shapirobacteria bacterium CG09_land_8_20_14_0_10_39_12]
MPIKEVYYYSGFKKSAKKYQEYQELIKKKIKILLQDPFDKSLKTHKLSGQMSEYWSFSVNFHLRILFKFIDETTIGLVDIGTHGIYK